MPLRSKLKFLKFNVFAVVAALDLAGTAAACDLSVVDLRSETGKARFSIDIADDDKERAQGLMFVEKLSRFDGMLFVYDAPLHAFFWMKNTLIPLDMLFIDATGTVTSVHENATPLSEVSIDGGQDVLAVLEINGGLARTLGLGVGTQVRHPAFSPDAAVWPCEN